MINVGYFSAATKFHKENLAYFIHEWATILCALLKDEQIREIIRRKKKYCRTQSATC
jgi:hypothetical protein